MRNVLHVPVFWVLSPVFCVVSSVFSSTLAHEKASGWGVVEIGGAIGCGVKGVNEKGSFGAVAVEVAGKLFTGVAVVLASKGPAPNTKG